jgi:hypothetical protein
VRKYFCTSNEQDEAIQVVLGYWGATEQKTRLRIQATSTIESDGLAAVSGYGSDSRQSGPHGPQRLGSIQYLLFRIFSLHGEADGG